MSSIADYFWTWPNGLVWRLTRGVTERSRRQRFALFMKVMSPGPKDRILDVGAGDGEGQALNFFEAWYPWRRQVTALALEDLPAFRRAYPEIKLVIGDGRRLPFADQTYDIFFSNAVIEHVGSAEQQRQFIVEACRVARRVFLATPNRWFPIDAHTMIPCAHWLPLTLRNAIYRLFGRRYYASEARLRLLGVRDLRRMLPVGVNMTVYRQRSCGWTANINVLLEHQPPASTH